MPDNQSPFHQTTDRCAQNGHRYDTRGICVWCDAEVGQSDRLTVGEFVMATEKAYAHSHEPVPGKQQKRCAVSTPHGFYIDSENCGLDWTFGAEDKATRLSPKPAQLTADILNRLGISAVVKTYE